jgi:hypothetical protein
MKRVSPQDLRWIWPRRSQDKSELCQDKRHELKKDTLSEALSGLDHDFRSIQGYDVISDGEYWTVVEDVMLEVAQPSGSPRIIWKLRILGPDNYARRLQRTLVITPDSMQWLKKDLFLCGLGLESLKDLPGKLENLINLKVKVRKKFRSIHIIACDGGVSEEGHLFLHLVDETGQEYLDQQLWQQQCPQDEQEFEAIVDHFVTRYQCPSPHEAYLEDAETGQTLFRM